MLSTAKRDTQHFERVEMGRLPAPPHQVHPFPIDHDRG